MIKTKVCSKCKTRKRVTQYHISKNKKHGISDYCKDCAKIIQHKSCLSHKKERLKKNKIWRDTNKEKCSKLAKNNYLKNKDKILTRNKKRYKNNKKEILLQQLKYKKDNKDKVSECIKKSIAKNKEHYKTTAKRYRKKRKKEDISFRLICNTRSRINKCIKNKSKKTIDILGCTPNQFRIHIEKQMLPGMTWDNYGFRGWHIDHIIPVSSGKTKEEIEKLFHYTNCQPLWAKDNLLKSNKVP